MRFLHCIVLVFNIIFLPVTLIAGEGEPDKKSKDKKDSIGREYLEVIDINFETGLFSEKYLPFDVPFILSGNLPEDVVKVAIVYGPAKSFEQQHDQLNESLEKEHRLHVLKMRAWSKEDLSALKAKIEIILTGYYKTKELDLNQLKNLNSILVENMVLNSGIDPACWKCVKLENPVVKFKDCEGKQVDNGGKDNKSAESDCKSSDCEISTVVKALEKRYLELTNEIENYKKYIKEDGWEKHDHLSLSELDLLLDYSTMKPNKIKSSNIGFAVWEKPHNYNGKMEATLESKVKEADKSSGSTDPERNFSLMIGPLKPNKGYRFYIKLYYDGTNLERETEQFLGKLLNDRFTSNNVEEYWAIRNIIEDQLKKDKEESEKKDTTYVFDKGCDEKYTIAELITQKTPGKPLKELRLTLLNMEEFNILQDSLRYLYAKKGIYNTEALRKTDVFQQFGTIDHVTQNYLDSLYERAFNIKFDWRLELFEGELGLESIRKDLIQTGYYKKLVNYYSTNNNYLEVQDMLKDMFANEKTFEDIVDGRRHADSSGTMTGGLWFSSSANLMGKNVKTMQTNIKVLDSLRTEVLRLRNNDNYIGVELFMKGSDKEKYIALGNKISSLGKSIQNYKKRIIAIDSNNMEIISLKEITEGKLAAASDNKDKIKELNKLLEQYKEIETKNQSRKQFAEARIAELEQKTQQAKDERDAMNIHEAIVDLNTSADEFLAYLERIILLMRDRQSKMEDGFYKIRQAERQFNKISSKLLEDVDFSATYSIAGTSTDEYVTRGQYYISADLGLAWISMKNETGTVQPYLGVNFNLFPINKQAHYNLMTKNWLRGTSIMLGATINRDDEKMVYHRNILSSNVTLLTGVGLRLSDFSRITAGVVWTEAKTSANPIVDNYKLAASPFVSLSLDMDVKKYLGGFGQLIFAEEKSERANIVKDIFK